MHYYYYLVLIFQVEYKVQHEIHNWSYFTFPFFQIMSGIDTTNINVSFNHLSFLKKVAFVRCKKFKKVVLRFLRQNHEVYHSKSYNSINKTST